VFEIAGGIVLVVIVLAALPKLIEVSIYAAAALLTAVGLLLLYWAWNVLPMDALALLGVTLVPIIFYLYSKNKDAEKERVRVETESKSIKDADFTIFLAESLK